MAINFKESVSDNTNNLIRWRQRYSKEEYPYKVVLNLFYDLIPLKQLWDELIESFGTKKFNDVNKSFDHVLGIFREMQLSLQPYLVNMLKDGVSVAGINSRSFDQLIHNAKARSNKDVEEIELSYIVRNPIKATSLSWYSLGLTGISKEISYRNVFNTMVVVSDWNSFDVVFQCFAQSAVMDIAGYKKHDGTTMVESLYKPLPNFW